MERDDRRQGGGAAGAAAGARRGGWLGAAVRLLLVVGILGGGAAGTVYLLKTRPRAKRRAAAVEAVPVRVRTVRIAPHRATVRAMGTVQPARRVQLAPRVAGQVVWVADELLPGGRFDANDPVARIDAEDYRLAVAQRRAEVDRLAAEVERARAAADQRATDVITAECAEQIEMGRQAVARREYELLGKDLPAGDRDLVLRGPQLRTARAATRAARAAAEAARAAAKAAEQARAAAENALALARLDLERTTVRSPFNALVVAKSVDVGSLVTAATPVATLVGTDEYWVQLSVPVDELRWIDLAGPGRRGSEVRVYYPAAWGEGAFRRGHVLRLAAALEPQGRMARLLVEVPDPLCLRPGNADRPAMILGSYVRVEILGRPMPPVAAVPRQALRDGENVWLMTPAGTLQIRPVRILRRDAEVVYVAAGLRAGERLIVSDLGTPVAGMKLRVGPTSAPASAPAGAGEARP